MGRGLSRALIVLVLVGLVFCGFSAEARAENEESLDGMKPGQYWKTLPNCVDFRSTEHLQIVDAALGRCANDEARSKELERLSKDPTMKARPVPPLLEVCIRKEIGKYGVMVTASGQYLYVLRDSLVRN